MRKRILVADEGKLGEKGAVVVPCVLDYENT